MSQYNQKEVSRVIAKLLRQLADEIENGKVDIDFKELLNIVQKSNQDEILKQVKDKETIDEVVANENYPSITELFSIYSKSGQEELSKVLEKYEIEQLKKIVAENGLDPIKKVRRWKTKEKVMDFILNDISQRMSHGSAFRNQDK